VKTFSREIRTGPLGLGPGAADGTVRSAGLAFALLLPFLFGPHGFAGAAGAGEPPRGASAIRPHAAPGLERLARRLATDSAVTAPMPGIGPPLSVLPSPPDLWVVRDLSRVPGAAEIEPDWVAGLAIPSRNVMAVRVGGTSEGRPEALARTARHELAHLALGRATGGRAPRWLQEGYAQLAAGDWDWGQAWRLRLIFLRRGGEVLGDLDAAFRGREDEARMAYLLSYTAVHRLLGMSGPGGLRALFSRLRGGTSFDEALRRVYGITEGQFVEAWRKSVRNRYGWLFFLSRASLFWIAVTMLLLVVGWRRRRHDRRRWEELREEERRAGPDPEPAPWDVAEEGHDPR